MRANVLIPALAGALLCLTACDIENFGGFERYTRDFHYSYPLKTGGRLSLETFNGSVEISAWDQDTVDISGTKTGPTQDAVEALKVSIDNSPDSVSVRVVRPSERRNNLGARFVIKVPRNAYIDRITTSNGPIRLQDGMGPAKLRTSNGSVRVQSLRGALDAQTSNGPIDLLEVDGDATAHSSNGHIHAEHVAGSLDATTSNNSITAIVDRPNGNVREETSNGGIELTLPDKFANDVRARTNNNSITVHLPPDPNAHVIASTSNSSISSDFDMRVHGEIRKNYMDAILGSGGPTIELNTSNGGIRLMRH
jgi:DUF4097 and DUF4098 domain-containing protein YvlB